MGTTSFNSNPAKPFGKTPQTPAMPAKTATQSKNFPQTVWNWLACFRSIQLAIVLLSLLALATLAGVLLPQDGLVDTADIKRQFGANYRVFKSMGFFNVYSSYWFIALEVLFFFNLLFGSFQWLKPAYLAATRQTYLSADAILNAPNRLSVPLGNILNATTVVNNTLKKRGYWVFQEASDTLRLYATKGNWSRFGPVVAHFGILLLLVASVYGAFTGFKAQRVALPGETFALTETNSFIPNIPDNFWQGHIPDWKVRVDDFKIVYYPENPTTPQQFYADLSILKPDGSVMKQQTISVNHPLSVDDVTIYQANFSPTGKLFTEINGKPATLEVNNRFEDRRVSMTDIGKNKTLIVFPFFVQQDQNAKTNYVVMFIKTNTGFLGEAPGKMPENLRLSEGESGTLGGMTFKYIRPEISTGLQIKKAPEVPWTYLAFLIIATGTVMCIFSQRQIWFALKDGQLLAHFKTNKGRLSFLKELQAIQKELSHG